MVFLVISFKPFHTEAESLEDDLFLSCQNKSSLTLWSPFPVCIWPFIQDYISISVSIFFGLTELSEFCMWTMVCHVVGLNESCRNAHILTETDYKTLQSLWARPDHFAAASKYTQSVRSKQAFKSCSASLVHRLTVLNTGLADLIFACRLV